VLSAAFAMDEELCKAPAAYRALSMPFYMENYLRQLDAICGKGVFYLTGAGDMPLPTIATRDIAHTAADLLTDRSWTGQENLPVFGPDRLTPDAMADIISEELGREVVYRRVSIDDYAAQLRSAGATERAVHDVTDAFVAHDQGIYDPDWAAAKPTSTDFRTWCREVLKPAADAWTARQT
jgi:uncharacterized protein YbjT (DUF2867 family)